MKIKSLIYVLAMVLIVAACSKVPVTGRRQMNLLPESNLMSMSLTSYQDFLKNNQTVPADDERTKMVQKVGGRIAKSVSAYLKKHGQGKRIEGYNWEFNVVDDELVNAWAMPGGKVVVYTGILPVAESETGLAVVMGHEVAHAIARHGNERMSQQLAIMAGGVGLNAAMSEQPERTREILLASYGVSTGLASLKYSRKHESEADKMGLVFMAMAGYSPDEAPKFWSRMSTAGGSQGPEFLSTHPSHETRISDLEAYLPEARKYYKP